MAYDAQLCILHTCPLTYNSRLSLVGATPYLESVFVCLLFCVMLNQIFLICCRAKKNVLLNLSSCGLGGDI